MKRLISILLAGVTAFCLFSITASRSFAATSGSAAGVVSTSSGSLNVRSSASSSGAILSTLPKGSYVTLLSGSGSWWQVEYASGKYGYCSSSYIQKQSGSYASYVSTSGGSLNVRYGAGTTYGVQSSLPNGKAVVVLLAAGGWSRVLYNGTSVGYVSSSYLKAYSSAASTYSAVKLTVPSYKQTDSRWSGYRIGTGGGTIGTIGCATTALAMMESYRTGTTVTPPVMASRLTYTSGGSVYWPNNYTFFFTDSYSAVYQALKSGKPVLYGAKNNSGGQHWVVITGFTGGSALTASGFTINDPGSGTRTTLQQYLNSYPVFYKYAVYA